MNFKVRTVALTALLAAPLMSSATAQSAVDFREAVQSVEPSLVTVISLPDGAEAKPNNQEKQDDIIAAPKGPQIQLFKLDGQPLPGAGAPPRNGFMHVKPQEISSAAFAVDEATLIAYIGSHPTSIIIESVDGQEFIGKVIALDYVTGLAAIKIEEGQLPALIVGAAQAEPGTPVIAAWLDDHVFTIDAGTVATRPVASDSGIGAAPKIDFGTGQRKLGSPVLDSNGIVIGVLVPGRGGELVCASSSNIQRLVDAASADNPQDLKRGLIGIQFEGGGALVMEVSDESAASKAGIKAGDLVEQVGSMKIRDAQDVVAAVASARAGDTIDIDVRRDDKPITIQVTLGEHPQQQLASVEANRNGFAMQQAFELKDGKLVPMEINPNGNGFPFGPGQFPMNDMLKQLQQPNGPMWNFDVPGMKGPVDGFQVERSDVEKTLKELQRQMEQLNEKLDKDR